MAAANLAISRVENALHLVQTGVTHNKADWASNREQLRQQNEQLELLQRELLILETDYPKTRVNLRQVQTTVSELQKRTAYLDQMNQSYLKGLQEVGGDLDSLARSIDTQLQTNCREEQRARLELKLSMDGDISTVVSGFGRLSTFVAQEVPRLIQSRDAHILAVQEACKALHANQQVLTGILQNQTGLAAPPYPPISGHNPQSSSGNRGACTADNLGIPIPSRVSTMPFPPTFAFTT
jgi:hypothetical protein